MQQVNIVKVTSFGRTAAQDRKHLQYINRHGTAEDDMGNPVDINKQLDLHNTRTSKSAKISTRLSISLPRENTQQAYDIIRDMLLDKYGAFVTALHNDKGNPHMHVYIQNLDRLSFSKLHDKDIWARDIQNKLAEQGISYGFSRDISNPRPRYSLAEYHMQKSQHTWLDSMRGAVTYATTYATDYKEFETLLSEHGITAICNNNNITLVDSDNNKARLSRLYSNMATMQDIEMQLRKEQLMRDIYEFTKKYTQGLPHNHRIFGTLDSIKEDIRNRPDKLEIARERFVTLRNTWIAQHVEKQKQQRNIDKEISMARDILNPPNVLKKQDQEKGNDNIYIDRIFGR